MKPLLIPLFGSAVGAWVASRFGVPWTAFVPNVAGLGVGFLILRFARPISSAVAVEPEVVARVAVGILVLTLVFPGVEGVRRWISIGQFRLNASVALTPLLLAAFARIKRSRDLILVFAVAAVHLAQPDAGQATVFALGASVTLLIRQGVSPLYRIAWPIGLLTLAVLTWYRPDPLGPIRHVEGILHSAVSWGTGATLAAGLAAALALLPFLRPKRTLGAAYLVLLLGSFAVTWLGNFPVPLLGAGAASIIAWCLMVALDCPRGRGHREDGVRQRGRGQREDGVRPRPGVRLRPESRPRPLPGARDSANVGVTGAWGGRDPGAVSSPPTRRRLRRAFGVQGWAQDPLMPHTAELLLADLDPATRRQIWKSAAAHARRTAGRIEKHATNFLFSAFYLLFCFRFIIHRTHGYVFPLLLWLGFVVIYSRISDSILGRRRAIRYVRAELAKLGRCPECGYDLCATPGRCPECGHVPAAKAET